MLCCIYCFFTGSGKRKLTQEDRSTVEVSSKKTKQPASHASTRSTAPPSGKAKTKRQQPSSSSSSSSSSSDSSDSSDDSGSSPPPVKRKPATKTLADGVTSKKLAAKSSANPEQSAVTKKSDNELTTISGAKYVQDNNHSSSSQPLKKKKKSRTKKKKPSPQSNGAATLLQTSNVKSNASGSGSAKPSLRTATPGKAVSVSSSRNHIVFDSGDESAGSDFNDVTSRPASSAVVSTVASISPALDTGDLSRRQLCAVPPQRTAAHQTPPASRGRGKGRGSNAGHTPNSFSPEFGSGSRYGSSSGSQGSHRGRGSSGGSNSRGRGRGRGVVTGGPKDVLTYSSRIMEQSADLKSLAAAAAAWTTAFRNLPPHSSPSLSSPNRTVSAPVDTGSGSSPSLRTVSTSPSGQVLAVSPAQVTTSEQVNGACPTSSSNDTNGATLAAAAVVASDAPLPAANGTKAPLVAAVSHSKSAELRDYSKYALCKGQPPVGSVVAFKVSTSFF